MLFLGVSAGLANLDIRYADGGLSVHTGWSRNTPPAGPVSARVDAAAQAGKPAWAADLKSVEDTLRAEMRAANSQLAAASSSRSSAEVALMQRVKVLIDDAERREQRELALRMAELQRDSQVQRQADLARIDRSLGVIQNNTGFEVMRQRELLNSLAVKVSQTR